jgi:SAM-dependent methyltransferase
MIRNIWPVDPGVQPVDKLALRSGHLPGYCNICGRLTVFQVSDPNFRESVNCRHCNSTNRQRQMAAVLLSYAAPTVPTWAKVRDVPPETVVWITEATKALHDALSQQLGKNCIATEFLDPTLASGETKDGILHVDMQQTHFADNSFDFILSSDVMEHVPVAMKALQETYRVLKPGGCHIFTAPFYQHRFRNEQRTVLEDSGEPHYLRRPWYHLDPLRAEGALVFTIFAPELLCQLEELGFEARLCLLHSTLRGILGNNAIVIVARKAIPPNYADDTIFPGDTWPPPDPGVAAPAPPPVPGQPAHRAS